MTEAIDYEFGTEPDEAEARRRLAEQRVLDFNQRITGLDELPLDSEQQARFAERVMDLHAEIQDIKFSKESPRGEIVRLYLTGAPPEEMAEKLGRRVMTDDLRNTVRFLKGQKLTSTVCSEAARQFAANPEVEDLAEILPLPAGIQPRSNGLEGSLSGFGRPGRARKLESPIAPETPSAEADSASDSEEESDEKPDENDGDDEEEPPREESGPTTDLVRAYLKEIGRVALLDAEQEVDLAKRIEVGLYATEKLRQIDGGELHLSKNSQLYKDYQALVADGARAKDHLVEANLRLVASVAKRYSGKGMDYLDLIQEGNLGLIRAVEKFDYTKGFKFSTYATWWIRQAITRAMADQSRTIRVPVHMVEQINKMTRVRRDMTRELNREPTTEELAEQLDMTPDKVLEIERFAREPVSIQQDVGDDGKSQLGDFIEDADAPIAAEIVDSNDLRDELYRVLGTLPAREEWVMRKRFGLDDGKPQTLDEIGRQLGLTRERIRQMVAKTLEKLNHPSRNYGLRDYLR